MSGGGKSGGTGDQTVTVRYAPYIEGRHGDFLNTVADIRWNLIGGGDRVMKPFVPIYLWRMEARGADGTLYDNLYTRHRYTGLTDTYGFTHDSPYLDYEGIAIEAAFFSAGYTIASFPSLYDMYGKFMAGLDVDTLFSQIFEDTVNAPEVNDLVAAEGALMDDDIDANVLPRFLVGMRDINSVMSSSFLVGKSIIEDGRVKALEKFRAELKYRLIPVAEHRWATHLEWNKSVVMSYAEIMKLYFSAKMDVEDFNYSMIAKHDLWPFTVLDYERAALGALQGATTTNKEVAGASKLQKAVSGALSGAAAGGMIGGMIKGSTAGTTMGLPGAIVGGVLGLASSLI